MGRPNPNTIRVCKLCGREFHPASSRQHCCNLPTTRVCIICGKEFEVPCTTSNTSSTCSIECSAKRVANSRKASAQKLTRVCKYCGKEFHPNSVRDVYCYEKHYSTCVVCGKQFEVDIRAREVANTCSKECRYKYATSRRDIGAEYAAMVATLQSKYGVSNPMQIPEVIDKIKETNKKKYGVEWYLQSDDYKEKTKQTDLEKYGVEHHLSSPEVIAKRIETLKTTRGVENVFQLEDVKEKAKQTNIEKFGVEYASQSPEIHRKQFENRINNVAIDGKHFDSSYEVLFYNFLLKVGCKNIETQVPLEFDYGGSKHITYIDFRVNGIFFEVKGSHLLDGVFDYNMTIPIEAKLDLYRKHHVILITNKTDKVNAIFGKPNSAQSNGLKYLNKCPNPLIGIDITLFCDNPEFPYTKNRPKCFYDVKVDGRPSSHEAFYDPEVRWKMILNRINYSGGFIDNRQILTAMNVTRTCKQPSWFSVERAKQIIQTYCSSDTIYDLAAGWGARADACKELGKTYIACDYNKRLTEWYDEVGKTHIEWCDGRTFKTDEKCSIFICPPYSDPETGRCFEDYNFEGFDESAQSLTQCKWLEIAMKNAPNFVDATMVCKIVDPEWEQYIVDTIENKSHLGVNTEYVLHVERQNR